MGLSFAILSDAAFKLTEALRLPTMTVEGMRLIKRLTLIIIDGMIEHVFYPVFPPNRSAADVIAWLQKNPPIDEPAYDSGVVIYTTPACPYCKAAKALLAQKGVAFTEVEVEVEGDAVAAQTMVVRSRGRRTVPQIFVGPVHVGSADDLQALDATGRLDGLLSGRL